MPARTTISKRHAIACLGTVLIFSLQQWQATSPGRSKESDVHHDPAVTNESFNTSPGSGEPPQTKRTPRPVVPKAMIEETSRLLRETVLTRLATESAPPRSKPECDVRCSMFDVRCSMFRQNTLQSMGM